MADFIVAIELGSSKMTGIAGRKNSDGSISVTALATEDSSTFIRKGVVYNIDKTVLAINQIIGKLEKTLKTKIAQVYVGVGGRSIHSVINTHVKDLPAGTVVTQEMVDQLMDANRSMDYPEQEILDAVTQEYKVDLQYQLDPVGIPCSRLEGNFLNILFRRSFHRNLMKCFETAGVAIADTYLAPIALADSVLTDNEKRNGCVLMDLGADTTTVAVYSKNVLRSLTVIPLGGANITKDIAMKLSLTDEAEAEKMKLRYASAYVDEKDINMEGVYPVGNETTVPIPEFIKVVSDRFYEIILNAWETVPSDLTKNLSDGIILTGGGSNLRNVDEAVRRITKVKKVRVAHNVQMTINSSNPLIMAHDGRMNTILGLLAKGDMNCAGPEFSKDLFGNSGVARPASGSTTVGVQPTGNATVAKPAQVANVTASAGGNAKPSSEEPTKNGADQKVTKPEEEKEPQDDDDENKPTILSKMKHSMGRFFRTIISEEEDEK